MFRKIHSNRDPRDTVFTEMRKEFSSHIQKFNTWFCGICLKFPKLIYTAMVVLIMASFVLSILLFRKEKPKSQTVNVSLKTAAPVPDGFGQIMQKGYALKEAVSLKAQVEALIAKDSLSSKDSVSLGKAIDRLHDLSIQNQ